MVLTVWMSNKGDNDPGLFGSNFSSSFLAGGFETDTLVWGGSGTKTSDLICEKTLRSFFVAAFETPTLDGPGIMTSSRCCPEIFVVACWVSILRLRVEESVFEDFTESIFLSTDFLLVGTLVDDFGSSDANLFGGFCSDLSFSLLFEGFEISFSQFHQR